MASRVTNLKYPCRKRTVRRCKWAKKSCRVVDTAKRTYCRKTRNRRLSYRHK